MMAFRRVAEAAAHEAAALLRKRYGRAGNVSYKGEVDLVTAADRDAERLIVDTLAAAFPDHATIGEELPPRPGTAPYRWYVDPLDGTTNFAHGYPQFAVSVALVRAAAGQEEEPVVAVVVDPLRRETFTAVRGGGAQLNGRPIRVSTVSDLDRALVATGFPYDRREKGSFYLAFYEAMLERVQGIRRAGSAALDLCYVACGRLDAFWEWRLRPWDTAAGRLVVEEAGGRVSDFQSGPHRLEGEQTAASNGLVHDRLLAVIGEGFSRARAYRERRARARRVRRLGRRQRDVV